MNLAIGYVESHLCDEIDTEALSGIMACPFDIFQRFFVQITGIPLSEYIRRRKLTCVAFKRMHGVSPNMARKPETILKFYSRLNFTLVIKGVFEMNYQTAERKSFKVVGMRRTTPYGGGTWGIGIECETDHEGFESYTYPDCSWLQFTAEGALSENVLGNLWKRIYEEFLPQSKYRQAIWPTIEVYREWNEQDDRCVVDIMIPVEK